MNSAQETHEEWTDGDEPGVRPLRVQALRTEIRNYTDHSPPRRIGEIVEWLDEHAEGVADGLAEAAGDEPDPNDGDEPEPEDDRQAADEAIHTASSESITDEYPDEDDE